MCGLYPYTPDALIEDPVRVRHTYDTPGTYDVKAEFELWGLPARSLASAIRVD